MSCASLFHPFTQRLAPACLVSPENFPTVPTKVAPTVGALHGATTTVLFYISLTPRTRQNQLVVDSILPPFVHGDGVFVVALLPLFVGPAFHPLVLLCVCFTAQTTERRATTSVVLVAHRLPTLALCAFALRLDVDVGTVWTGSVDGVLHTL